MFQYSEVVAVKTINPPAEGQVINFTSMTCPVAFLVLRGRSGVYASFGFTNDVEKHPLSIGLTVQFPTPEFFPYAKGNLLASSQLRPADTTEPAAKRLKAAQLVGGGEMTSHSGERAIMYNTDLDGGRHATRSKSELSIRERDTHLGFRVVDPERWPHLMGVIGFCNQQNMPGRSPSKQGREPNTGTWHFRPVGCFCG